MPAVITVQGVYCFTGDLATAITTGNAIGIQVNNVVLGRRTLRRRYRSAGPPKYRDNLTFDLGTPFLGGTNAGNNN